jgi:hypothetical protein
MVSSIDRCSIEKKEAKPVYRGGAEKEFLIRMSTFLGMCITAMNSGFLYSRAEFSCLISERKKRTRIDILGGTGSVGTG